MIWDEKHFAFYVDDIEVASFKKDSKDTFDEWPFDQPFHLILNIAVGGTWGGEVDETMLPFEMVISKIEVFQ
jgi:beta-glucanase (GH16 family)